MKKLIIYGKEKECPNKKDFNKIRLKLDFIEPGHHGIYVKIINHKGKDVPTPLLVKFFLNQQDKLVMERIGFIDNGIVETTMDGKIVMAYEYSDV